MTSLYDSQEFYKKMLELQERLRKSEDERMKLEKRFDLLSQDSRSRREACINNLRMRYIDFLEEQRLRDERNHQILGALDKIDGSLARMTARTDRLGILRKQYESYLLRVYANRSVGGGTGDSGVGSHNEDRSPKTNVLPTEKNPPTTQRIVTQDAGNPLYSIPQINHPQSYVRASDSSQFNVPRYTLGQDISQVQVMQAHGQGDGSAIVQPHRMPQHFYGFESPNTTNITISKTQMMPNASQEFVPSNQSYDPHQLLRSNSAQVQRPQFPDVSNQYLENPRSPYVSDPSMIRRRNIPDSQEIISSNLQPIHGLQPHAGNARGVADLSLGLIDETFGPYRHSTPLPGYLDYSTRYSRNLLAHESNLASRYGFTKNDLKKVIHKNEQILPKDYLHNSETVKPAMHTSKLSSLLEVKRSADTKPSKSMNDDELDQYINRIRSLHRDNDQSLEALDVEQNTSGDLLNATLSDDGPEQLELHSDEKVKLSKTDILSDDVKNVFALADDFVAETANLADESQFDNEFSNDREIPSKSVFSPQVCNEDIVAKSKFAKSNAVSPAVLRADMASKNLSISATRDDILSGTVPDGVNQIQNTSAFMNNKFSPEITPLIADVDTSRPNITHVATVSQNNLVDPNELSPNERGSNQALSSSSQEYLKDHQDIWYSKDHDPSPKEIEIHEDIEGDKVSLIANEQTPEQVIDVVRELQPPSLKHYEKNVVEIRVSDKDQKDTNIGKLVPEGVVASEIQENKERALQRNPTAVETAETLPQVSIPDQIHAEYDITDQKYSEAEPIQEQIYNNSGKGLNDEPQYHDDPESLYEPNQNHEYPIYEQPGQNAGQDVDENRDNSQRFEQNSQELHDPSINTQLDYETRQTDDETNRLTQPYVPESDEPYDSNQIYDGHEHYETDPSEQCAQESDPQFAYDSHPNFEDDPNALYGADPNEHYAAHSNEQYTTDPNEQYPVGSNEQYATDSNGQYAVDSNEQYGTNPSAQYPTDPNEHYVADSNAQYAVHPNEQYGYYENQPYQDDPNAVYDNAGDEQYQYDTNHDYEHDPNQQYQHDLNQQFEVDPNQQYEQDPNESLAQDSNQEHKEHEYGQNLDYESAGYEEPEQSETQQFENNSQQDYAGRNLALESSSNQDYLTATVQERNEIQASTGELQTQESSDPVGEIRAEEYSAAEKKKNKDVIRALLESDTESTIERNPSNNTESDFDFN